MSEIAIKKPTLADPWKQELIISVVWQGKHGSKERIYLHKFSFNRWCKHEHGMNRNSFSQKEPWLPSTANAEYQDATLKRWINIPEISVLKLWTSSFKQVNLWQSFTSGCKWPMALVWFQEWQLLIQCRRQQWKRLPNIRFFTWN